MAAENLLVKQVFVLLSVVSMDSPAITDNGSCLEECVPVNNGLMFKVISNILLIVK